MRRIQKDFLSQGEIPTAHKSASDERFLSGREDAKSKLCWPEGLSTTIHPLPEPAGIFMGKKRLFHSSKTRFGGLCPVKGTVSQIGVIQPISCLTSIKIIWRIYIFRLKAWLL